MRDLMPEWIADYERLQDMSFEISALIDEFADKQPDDGDMNDVRRFLADRHDALQHEIDRLRDASLGGSQILLMEEED